MASQTPQVEGTCDAKFASVKQIFQTHLSSGAELGAALYVSINGTPVLDLWGGYASRAKDRPWTASSITTVWSTSKCATSLAALLLIDRGQLSPTAKVSTYWPEFAQNGKEDIEVRHLLSHTSGVPGWDAAITPEDLFDIPKSTALLEAQAPWWTPGTASGYQALTMGHLVGEVVRRVTGQNLRDYIRDELATPLGADFQLGCREEDWPRCADIQRPPPSAGGGLVDEVEAATMDPNSIPAKAFGNPPLMGDAEICNTEPWRRTILGAVNGHTNAKGVARLLDAVTLGGGDVRPAGEKPVLSQKTVDLIFQEQASGVDKVLGLPVRIGVGYGLTGKDTVAAWLPEGRVCFWGGWGGSMVIMDLDRKMTIAYVMNKMENEGLGNDRTKDYVGEIYKVLGVL